jgi:ankyrin repeat protein
MSGVTEPSLTFPTYLLMDQQLHNACSKGNLELIKALIRDNPTILTSVTPDGNNCLHLAAMLGYNEFAKEVWSRKPSLFLGTNKAGETPLVTALAADNASLASDMIAAASQLLQPDMEGETPLNAMLLKFDTRGNSVLHHAMRNGLEDLAVLFLDIEPLLSTQANKIKESPMHMAARRGYIKVLERLLSIRSSSYSGPGGTTALHAAVEAGRTGYTYI